MIYSRGSKLWCYVAITAPGLDYARRARRNYMPDHVEGIRRDHWVAEARHEAGWRSRARKTEAVCRCFPPFFRESSLVRENLRAKIFDIVTRVELPPRLFLLSPPPPRSFLASRSPRLPSLEMDNLIIFPSDSIRPVDDDDDGSRSRCTARPHKYPFIVIAGTVTFIVPVCKHSVSIAVYARLVLKIA